MIDKELFEVRCREDSLPDRLKGIGTYSEKRLHRILKSLFADDNYQEIPVGDYVADVLCDGVITEVQTGSFIKYLPKLKYYLDATEYKIRIAIPVIAEKMLIRIDGETGEVIRKKRSPLKKGFFHGLAALYPIREILPSDRIEVDILLIYAEEHRYSERVKYRRSGAYISDLLPQRLTDERIFSAREDFLFFLPNQDKFTAKEYSDFSKMKGRELYSCLNTLCQIGVISRKKEGKAYVYEKTKD